MAMDVIDYYLRGDDMQFVEIELDPGEADRRPVAEIAGGESLAQAVVILRSLLVLALGEHHVAERGQEQRGVSGGGQPDRERERRPCHGDDGRAAPPSSCRRVRSCLLTPCCVLSTTKAHTDALQRQAQRQQQQTSPRRLADRPY